MLYCSTVPVSYILEALLSLRYSASSQRLVYDGYSERVYFPLQQRTEELRSQAGYPGKTTFFLSSSDGGERGALIVPLCTDYALNKLSNFTDWHQDLPQSLSCYRFLILLETKRHSVRLLRTKAVVYSVFSILLDEISMSSSLPETRQGRFFREKNV